MDQLRAPVIQLPEEPPPFFPPFAAHQLSERRFIYLRQLHMNVIITPGRPLGVRGGGFPLTPPTPLPSPPTVSADLPSSLLQVLMPGKGSLLCALHRLTSAQFAIGRLCLHWLGCHPTVVGANIVKKQYYQKYAFISVNAVLPSNICNKVC